MSESRVLLISGYLLGQCSTGSEIFEIGTPTTTKGPAVIVPYGKLLAVVALSDTRALLYGGEACGTSVMTDGTYLMDLDLNMTTLVAASTVNGPRCT